jgi:hypothetical protein
MDEDLWRGDLTETPVAQLLFHFWERRKSGTLRLENKGTSQALLFSRGELALAQGYFSEDGFLRRLMSARLIGVLQAEECAGYARQSALSLPRALIEREVLAPGRVWELLTEAWLEECLPLFDWPQGKFVFEPAAEVPAARLFLTVSTLEFILRGIRRMKNYGQIETLLPPEAESVKVLTPAYAGLIPLSPPERHILGLLQESPRLFELYSQSQVGKRETQRIVLALLSLGLAGFPQSPSRLKSPAEISSTGLEKIWTDFNDKCSYIFRYISKEIGPVALSVLEKALEEVRSRLAAPLQSLELRADGRVEFKPFPLMTLNLFNAESRQNFIRVLNEILVAEVLAVKKTLGDAHEAAVVKGLEKVGEPN